MAYSNKKQLQDPSHTLDSLIKTKLLTAQLTK
jgi:hypothetical protein